MQVALAFRTARWWITSGCLFALISLGACGGEEKQIAAEACTVNADCAGTPATPYCKDALTCVGCLENSHCTSSSAPICDLGSNTCRGCSMDSECASGVCLAAAGTCAEPAQILYVNATAGTNNATCDKLTPCRTMLHTKGLISGTRNVIRVIGPLTETVELQTKVHVDGDGSTWTASSTPLNVGTGNGAVTVEGFTIQGPAGSTSQPVIQCLNSGALRVHDVKLTGAGGSQPAIYSVCDTTITKSEIFSNPGGAVYCEGQALRIEDSLLRDNQARSVDCMGCSVTMARNRITALTGGQSAVRIASAPMMQVENNLITERASGAARGIEVTNGPTGGQIRFNTLVNITAGAHTGEGISCAGTSVVTSNVIAWQNGLAQGGNACARRYNAFDSSTAIGTGEGNLSAALAALFVNPASDFHLAAGSPAHGLAEPGAKVAQDLEGKARPTDGRLDAGAYETP